MIALSRAFQDGRRSPWQVSPDTSTALMKPWSECPFCLQHCPDRMERARHSSENRHTGGSEIAHVERGDLINMDGSDSITVAGFVLMLLLRPWQLRDGASREGPALLAAVLLGLVFVKVCVSD